MNPNLAPLPGADFLRAVRAGACVALGFSLLGCGGPTFIAQQYAGPVRPRESIAIIRVNGDSGLALLTLDGEDIATRVPEDARLHVEVLPGPHRLIIGDVSGTARAVGRAAFVAEAGKTYRPVFSGEGPAPIDTETVIRPARVYEVDDGRDTLLRDVTLARALEAPPPLPPP
ncbi:MAG: hypothetical protein IPI67_12575 [Myxococcales bacterium]|nr:hypothetical protein [Myxococcales bacterium]